MKKGKFGLLLLLASSMFGCTPEPYSVKVGYNNGSTTGSHIVSRMVVGGVDFSMGAVGTYPGKASTGGRMWPPTHIEGDWAKESPEPNSKLISYHRISMDIPKDAEVKMKLMDNYYQNFERTRGHMEVIVDGPRVRVFYTKGCYDYRMDCTPKKNIDPNNWVIKSPSGATDVVKLFDGIGESSKAPFPNTRFAERERLKKQRLKKVE